MSRIYSKRISNKEQTLRFFIYFGFVIFNLFRTTKSSTLEKRLKTVQQTAQHLLLHLDITLRQFIRNVFDLGRYGYNISCLQAEHKQFTKHPTSEKNYGLSVFFNVFLYIFYVFLCLFDVFKIIFFKIISILCVPFAPKIYSQDEIYEYYSSWLFMRQKISWT